MHLNLVGLVNIKHLGVCSQGFHIEPHSFCSTFFPLPSSLKWFKKIVSTVVWKRKLSFFSQFCEKLSASDWAACRATFRSSNFRCLLSVWVYQSLAYLLGRFGPNLFTVLFQFSEVCRLFLMLSSLEILPQHFSQAEWLQHLSFLPQSFCWSSYLTPEYLHVQRSSRLTKWLQGSQILCL